MGGWDKNTNPVDGVIARYRAASQPIRRRISYCKHRAKRVGSLARRGLWRAREQDARNALVRLQKELCDEIR